MNLLKLYWMCLTNAIELIFCLLLETDFKYPVKKCWYLNLEGIFYSVLFFFMFIQDAEPLKILNQSRERESYKFASLVNFND